VRFRRLLLDKDSGDARFLRLVRESGWDVVRAADLGWDELTDEQLLAQAASLNRTVYTANRRDFARLQKEWMESGRSHSGTLLRAPQGSSPSSR
jgi:hypothetical protein